MFIGLYNRLDVKNVLEDHQVAQDHVDYIREHHRFLTEWELDDLNEEILAFNKVWHSEIAEDLVVAKLKGQHHYMEEALKLVKQMNQLLDVINALHKQVDQALFDEKLDILIKGINYAKTKNPVRVATWPLGTKGKNKGYSKSRIRADRQRVKAQANRFNYGRRNR